MLQIFRINMVLVKHLGILYFFGYKMGFFSFPNNPKNLDLSYKANIDLLRLFRKGETCIIVKFHRNL